MLTNVQSFYLQAQPVFDLGIMNISSYCSERGRGLFDFCRNKIQNKRTQYFSMAIVIILQKKFNASMF